MPVSKHSNQKKLTCSSGAARVCFSVAAVVATCWLSHNNLLQPVSLCSHQLGYEGQVLIAQVDQNGREPYGPDPHGPDPHDEQHDKNMPANKAQDERKAPEDPYGREEDRNRAPDRREAQRQGDRPL
jgi:hypothetical protein